MSIGRTNQSPQKNPLDTKRTQQEQEKNITKQAIKFCAASLPKQVRIPSSPNPHTNGHCHPGCWRYPQNEPAKEQPTGQFLMSYFLHFLFSIFFISMFQKFKFQKNLYFVRFSNIWARAGTRFMVSKKLKN